MREQKKGRGQWGKRWNNDIVVPLHRQGQYTTERTPFTTPKKNSTYFPVSVAKSEVRRENSKDKCSAGPINKGRAAKTPATSEPTSEPTSGPTTETPAANFSRFSQPQPPILPTLPAGAVNGSSRSRRDRRRHTPPFPRHLPRTSPPQRPPQRPPREISSHNLQPRINHATKNTKARNVLCRIVFFL